MSKALKIILILLIFISGIILAQDNDRKVLPPVNGVYHTAFSSVFTKKSPVPQEEIIHFRELAGKNIVWFNFNSDWFNGIKFPAESVKNIFSQGVIPSVRVMPWSSYNSDTETVYTLENILNGKFDELIRQWARDAKESNVPLIIDFAPEANGNWFPWSGIYNGAGRKKYGDRNPCRRLRADDPHGLDLEPGPRCDQHVHAPDYIIPGPGGISPSSMARPGLQCGTES